MTIHEPNRTILSTTRDSLTHKRTVCGHKMFVTVSFFEDEGTEHRAKPGEVFVQVAKEGTEISGLVDALVTHVSISLQYGVPWEKIRSKLLHHIFGTPDDRHTSIVDGIAKIVDHLIVERCSIIDAPLPDFLVDCEWAISKTTHPTHSPSNGRPA
jgi:ribonucleoside-diphosphate reductase alpha chain